LIQSKQTKNSSNQRHFTVTFTDYDILIKGGSIRNIPTLSDKGDKSPAAITSQIDLPINVFFRVRKLGRAVMGSYYGANDNRDIISGRQICICHKVCSMM
jgi:hypothetical protein